REEFLVEACYHMRDRFEAREVYEVLGLPVQECVDLAEQSGYKQMYQTHLFQRIVPIVKQIGLWGPKVRAAYEDMGVMHYADTDLDALFKSDEDRAKELDERQGYVKSVIDEGANAVAAE
ncbi:MAG: aminobenzoate oxygenase, partial [Pseudomonadota bacterium]